MPNIGICVRCEKEFNRWFDELICGSCSEELWEESRDDLERMEIQKEREMEHGQTTNG